MTNEPIVLNETFHQPTRLRIMTLLTAEARTDRLAYTFIQQTLQLTGGNMTTHLRKLEEAGYVAMTKEFHESKPRTWVEATPKGRRAFAEYIADLEACLAMTRRAAQRQGE
ncbi:MAG: transcriptional regulator [Chloroflexota bacterium]|nr:transcriptional regulator [Chloroflexota bacterium]MDE2885007.1 transcriptional regulator [Chloroflexota bacterium]